MNNAIDVLVIGLIILLLYGSRIEKPISNINTDYLTLKTCNAYRGFFALVILFHHMSQITTSGILFDRFIGFGFLAVSVFFFYSGYGLMKKHMESDDYRKDFLVKRLPTVLIPFLIFVLAYWMVCGFFDGDFYSIKQILINLAHGHTLVKNAWYIIAIIVLYIAFWLLMLAFKKQYKLIVAAMFAVCILYVLICMKLEYGRWWYNTTFSFALGMIWAYKEKTILKLSKYYFIIMPICVALFSGFFLCALAADGLHKTTLEMLASCMFVVCVMLFSMKINIGNKALDYLGSISLEVYLTQGLFVMLLRSDYAYIENDLLWSVCVISGTIIVASLIHALDKVLIGKYKSKILNKKQSII